MCCAARGTRSTERGGRGAGFWEPIGAGRSALGFVGGGVLRTGGGAGGSFFARDYQSRRSQRGEETNETERDRRQARPGWAGEFWAKEWRQRNGDRETFCPHSFASIPLPNSVGVRGGYPLAGMGNCAETGLADEWKPTFLRFPDLFVCPHSSAKTPAELGDQDPVPHASSKSARCPRREG